jgi:hypothetical protein
LTGECAIELVLRRYLPTDISQNGRFPVAV